MMTQNLSRSVLLASYFEMYMMNKLDTSKIKRLGEDISTNLENDISATIIKEKDSNEVKRNMRIGLKKNLEMYNRRMEKLLMKIEEENIEALRGEKPSVWARAKPYLTIFVGECIGSLILLFIGCGAVITFDEDPLTSHHIKSLGFGFAVHVAVQIFGHITCCHINPAVSIVSLLLGYINFLELIIYISAQFLGSLLGFALLKILFPPSYTDNGFCMTKIGGGISVVQGFFVEVVITCFLCFVLCAVWDPRNATKVDSTPLRFGIVVGILSIIAGPLTGASMNTARSFGPAVYGSASDWTDQWVYWIAPNISPFISVGIYKLFFSEPDVRINRNQLADDAAVLP